MQWQIFAVVLVGTVVTAQNFPGVVTTQKYNHSVAMDTDGKFLVFWEYNETHIVFELHVETHGYVAFGLSPNGNMFPADVVMGWVGNGSVQFSDRHTTAHAMPVLDKSQDWLLLHGEETLQGTVLKFARKLDTCDDEDRVIQDGTVRLIYSYHPDDPVSDSQIPYHGAGRRGTKSVVLLKADLLAQTTDKADEHIKLYDFRPQNYVVPTKDTTYLCIGFQMPNLGQKHHMISFEPIITPGNEGHLHHLVIQRCHGRHPELHLKTAECSWEWPKDFPFCPEIAIVWAVGGQAFHFPEHVGFPFEDDSSFYIMQSHYDNPTRKVGMIDNSGIRVTLTSNLRQHEAGQFLIAHAVTPFQVIPPFEPAFVTKGYCAEECVRESMELGNATEVTVFAALHHAHLLATGLKTRHFRNGTELEPLLDDPSYDFNFQDMRLFRKEVPVRKGDSFMIECTYDTRGRTNVSFGGLSTREEMCETLTYYYPRTTLQFCTSRPKFDTYNLHDDMLHTAFEGMNWTDPAVRTDFRHRLERSTVTHTCMVNEGSPPWHRMYEYKAKVVDRPYIQPKSDCTLH